MGAILRLLLCLEYFKALMSKEEEYTRNSKATCRGVRVTEIVSSRLD
jgi:hypothetical protein